MNRADPFLGYSLLLRTILFVLMPAFAVWQFVRLRRALHVFQLEGYKRHRFIDWIREDPRRGLFARAFPGKKPLVMTGRAWRILLAATALSAVLLLGASAAAHLAGGAPYDLITWGVTTVVVFLGAPLVLVLADVLLSPVQTTINGVYSRRARRKLADVDPVVIGVTGSFGKTSTKFAIEKLVGPPGTALATPGSFNTPLGVCRTINECLQPAHNYLVVEMGAYREGEIADLCRFVHHKIGVLTAIGPAHLERFGSMEAIRRAKYEIVSSLPSEGVAVMNVDDPEVRALADHTSSIEVIRYGVEAGGRPDVTATDIKTTRDGMAFTILMGSDSLAVHTRLLGRHAVGHVLAGVAVATRLGRDLHDLSSAIEMLRPAEHRLQILDGAGGVVVIDDAYNANPRGAEAALEVLEEMPGNRKIVVTPGIVELGPLQFEENARFGERAAKVADTVIVVAKLNREALVTGARQGSADVITVDSLAEATNELRKRVASGDVVLFENDLPDQYEG